MLGSYDLLSTYFLRSFEVLKWALIIIRKIFIQRKRFPYKGMGLYPHCLTFWCMPDYICEQPLPSMKTDPLSLIILEDESAHATAMREEIDALLQ